jgi:hypothetical protein
MPRWLAGLFQVYLKIIVYRSESYQEVNDNNIFDDSGDFIPTTYHISSVL